jgi:hypothetical protein
MKIVTIDGVDVEVKECADCPFVSISEDDDMCCCYPLKPLELIESVEPFPPDCPLREKEA